MSAFDPTPGQPYGACNACPLTFDTEDAANQHMRQTMGEAKERGETPRSHSVTITNPPRGQRIRSRVGSIVDNAITDAMSTLDRLVDRGDVTEDEITEALRFWPDFADVREEWTS